MLETVYGELLLEEEMEQITFPYDHLWNLQILHLKGIIPSSLCFTFYLERHFSEMECIMRGSQRNPLFYFANVSEYLVFINSGPWKWK